MNRGPVLVTLSYVLWGFFPMYWKLLDGGAPFFILANRIIWSFVLTLLLLLVLRQRQALQAVGRDRRVLKTLAAASLFGFFNWGGYIYAVTSNHIIDASLAYYLNPILSIFIGAFLFRERLSAAQWVAVVFAVLGVTYAAVASQQLPWLALIIGGSWAVYGAIKKKVFLNGILTLHVEMAVILLPMTVFAGCLISQGQTGALSTWQWALLPTTGIATALPLILYNNGIPTTDYSLAGILMYINPTLQLILGVWLFGEVFTRTHGVMFAFVWGALLLYGISSVLQHRKTRVVLKMHNDV